MNVIMIIPTGIGCEIGGHAGDANPVARMLASACDNLLVHPNVMNASDIAELTDNMWYIEGSILDRFLEGHLALQKVYSNKIVLAVNKPVQNATINSVNAAKFTLGVEIRIVELDRELTLKGAFDSDGCATGFMDGHIEALDQLKSEMQENPFDALAIQTLIQVDEQVALDYLRKPTVNPWGGAEAVCSRYFSRELGIQSAHAPYEGAALKNFMEVVDPRCASEVVSISYIHCIFKGLHKAPRVVDYDSKTTIRVDEVDVLVSPDGCWGRPHIACKKRNIPVIYVRGNKNIYSPHNENEIKGIFVNNYAEAAGLISSMKAGVSRESIRV